MAVLSTPNKTKIIWRKGLNSFLASNCALVIPSRRRSIIKNVQSFLQAINFLPEHGVINKHWASLFVTAKTFEKIMTSCIQRADPVARHPKFRKLKAQSVRNMINDIGKFLLYLESYKLIERSDRKNVSCTINYWRKYLKATSETAKDNPLLDMSVLRLKEPYKQALELLNTPHLISDRKIATKVRDACIGKVTSRYGKRPCEYATTSLEGFNKPEKVDEWYVLKSNPWMTTKTSSKFGQMSVSVSPELWELLWKYIRHVRPILAAGTPEAEIHNCSLLWLTQAGRGLSGKVVCDIMHRVLECGNSGISIGSRSIRDTLATLGQVVSLNHQDNPKWRFITPAMSRGFRHSEHIHTTLYIKENRPLYNVRCDKLIYKLSGNGHITSNDLNSISDEGIVKSMIPSYSQNSTPVPTPIYPNEHNTPCGNKSSYEIIMELYENSFCVDSDTSASAIRERLSRNPHLVKQLLSNLKLTNLKNLQKVQSRCQTFKRFLKKQSTLT
jgi:site-specific recombinase XerD